MSKLTLPFELGSRVIEPVIGIKGVVVGIHLRLGDTPRIEVRKDGVAETRTANWWFAPHQLRQLPSPRRRRAAKAGA